MPQGSVLSPLLLNVYTNDQSEFPNTRGFLYANDFCITTQQEKFQDTEHILTSSLSILGKYYHTWFMKANLVRQKCEPSTCNITRLSKNFNYCGMAQFLRTMDIRGVTLDLTLTFKDHFKKLKRNVTSKNRLTENGEQTPKCPENL